MPSVVINGHSFSKGRPFLTHSAKLHPEDALRTSPYVPLCNAKGRPWPRSSGRWNMTSWRRSHNFLYVKLRDFPCRHLEDVCCRCYEDVPIWYEYYMNIILLKWPPQHSSLTIRKEGIWVLCLKLITRGIYFFHQKFYLFLFIFHRFNKFFPSKLPNFKAKLLCIKRKKIFHQQRP